MFTKVSKGGIWVAILLFLFLFSVSGCGRETKHHTVASDSKFTPAIYFQQVTNRIFNAKPELARQQVDMGHETESAKDCEAQECLDSFLAYMIRSNYGDSKMFRSEYHAVTALKDRVFGRSWEGATMMDVVARSAEFRELELLCMENWSKYGLKSAWNRCKGAAGLFCGKEFVLTNGLAYIDYIRPDAAPDEEGYVDVDAMQVLVRPGWCYEYAGADYVVCRVRLEGDASSESTKIHLLMVDSGRVSASALVGVKYNLGLANDCYLTNGLPAIDIAGRQVLLPVLKPGEFGEDFW